MEASAVTYQECPDCGTAMPVHRGYVTWCDRCGWNLRAEQPDRPRNIFESICAYLSQKQKQALFDQLVKADTIRSSLTVSKLLALVLATLVHGITAAFAASGLLVLIRGWPRLRAIAGGLVLLLIAWAVRPRIAKSPDGIVSRPDYATLYSLVDTIAASLGARRVDDIVVDHRFGAAMGQVGWKRRRVLHLGLPLWSILDDQERVALVAHELAHSVNGDPGRGLYIRSAIGSLVTWYAILRPARLYAPESGFFGLAMVPWNLIILSIAGLAWLGVYVLCHLIWQDSQRAEYLADYPASTVSGTEAFLSLLRKLHFRWTFGVVARRTALAKEADQHFFRICISGCARFQNASRNGPSAWNRWRNPGST